MHLTTEDYKIASQNGIGKKTVLTRLYRGWSKERAITEPILKAKVASHWYEVASSNGIKQKTYENRIRLGWDKQSAAIIPVGKYVGRYARKRDLESSS